MSSGITHLMPESLLNNRHNATLVSVNPVRYITKEQALATQTIRSANNTSQHINEPIEHQQSKQNIRKNTD